jgi:SAM-dependent methyltransferase
VLPALPPDRVVYYFTDLSELFLRRAQDRFKEYPFVRYGLLDVEQDPANQGLPAHGVDLVIATNVLHATKDLRQTLGHVRSLLAPGGVLALNELTDHPGWFDLGLVEGWSRYDDDVRTDSPVLSVARWTELLLASGFEQVGGLPAAASPAAVLGQHVIVAGTAAGASIESDAAEWRGGWDAARPSSDDGSVANAQAVDAFMQTLRDVLPAERHDLLTAYVRDHVSAVLRIGGAPIGSRHRLMDLGLDSLMAVELRNRLASGVALDGPLPATLMFDYPTIEAIAAHLDHRLGLDASAAPAPAPAPERERSAAAARVEELSDEEAEALLLEKLGNL